MVTMHDVSLIALGWGIPIILGWILAQIPLVRRAVPTHPIGTAIIVGTLVSSLIAFTSVAIYDKYFVARNIVVLAAENGSCPSGYRDISTVLLPHHKDAPEWFQTPKDRPTTGFYEGNRDWPIDHAKFCLRGI